MAKLPWILGIAASHNGAACILHGDKVIAAVQEERLSRKKRHIVYGSMPALCIKYCLDEAGITTDQLDYISLAVQGQSSAAENSITANPLLKNISSTCQIIHVSHHLAHAVSCYVTSGFKNANIVVIDGMGSPRNDLTLDEVEVCNTSSGWEYISIFHGQGNKVTPLEKHLVENGAWLKNSAFGMPQFNTLGGMYASAALQIFGDFTQAGKVMGLAAYGQPVYEIESFFNYVEPNFIFSDEICKIFSYNNIWPKDKKKNADLAASVQNAIQVGIQKVITRSLKLYDCESLCLSGGVALNTITNTILLRKKLYKDLYIFPAAEDSGTAIGAAYQALWKAGFSHKISRINYDSFGKIYTTESINEAVQKNPQLKVISPENIYAYTASLLEKGEFVGWFNGGSELGPRALCHRSILADPRNLDSKINLNKYVKNREDFRPFGPVILEEHVHEWFELDGLPQSNPFMLTAFKFKKDKANLVPAVVHKDNTGRLQTVNKSDNPQMYYLLQEFFRITGIPLLLNTSFNVAGEPIVETPSDAINCLIASGLAYCVFKDRIIFNEKKFIS